MKNKVIFTIIMLILLMGTVFAKTTLNVDINSDGVTDINDVKAIAEKIINKSSVSSIADIDQDGLVKINDVIILLKNINGSIPITGISFGESSKNLNVGSSITLTPTLTPSYANEDITYTSSNTAVATVNSAGKVTAASTGTATITAKAASSNTSAKITINVKEVIVYNTKNESSTSNYSYLYLNLNDKDENDNITAKLGAKINGTVASGISWKSSNTGVATIDNTGTVTAVSLGKTTITASSGGFSGTYTIRVKQKVVIVIGASQVNRLSCYVTDDTYNYAVSKTNYCSGTKESNGNIIHGSIVLGKYQYRTKATDIAKVLNNINAGGSLLRTSLTSEEQELLANYRYSDTLNFIHQSGSGFEFQVGGEVWSAPTSSSSALQWEEGRKSGWEIAEDIIRSYADVKGDVGFYIYFPIAGNATIDFGCNNWSDNYKQANYQLPSTSQRDDADNFYAFVDPYLEMYSNNINAMRNEGYYVWGNIVSAHPLVASNDTSGSIRYSNQTDACRAWYTNASGNKVKGKRSNLKYYLFNEVIEQIIETKYKNDYFNYVDTFNKIMDVTVDNSKTNIYEKYSFKFKDKYGGVLDSTLDGRNPTNYGTTDGLHWDPDTVHEYLKLMLEDTSRLK